MNHDPDLKLNESAGADLFSPLQGGRQDPEGAAETFKDQTASVPEPEKPVMQDPMPTSEDMPLYYAPGEPLSGRPGEYFKKQRDQALSPDETVQPLGDHRLEEPSGLSALPGAAPAPAGAQGAAPQFEHIRVSGADAGRFLDELSHLPPKPRDQKNGRGTADKSLFANVSLNEPQSAGDARPSMTQSASQESMRDAAPEMPETPDKQESGPAATGMKPRRYPHLHGMRNTVKVVLFLRQIVASFFTHTNLGLFLPRTAARLGPCFPSSMPLPFYLTGFLTALPLIALDEVIDAPAILGSALATLVFFLINGISGFGGITKLCAVFSSSRSGSSLNAAVITLYVLLIAALLVSLQSLMAPDLRLALTLAAAFALSALSGCALAFYLEADPVDSFGSLSLRGLLFALLVVLAAVYLTLPLLCATPMAGVAMLCNLLCGLYMRERGILVSRCAVGGVQLITLLMLLLYLVFAAGRMLL